MRSRFGVVCRGSVAFALDETASALCGICIMILPFSEEPRSFSSFAHACSTLWGRLDYLTLYHHSMGNKLHDKQKTLSNFIQNRRNLDIIKANCHNYAVFYWNKYKKHGYALFNSALPCFFLLVGELFRCCPAPSILRGIIFFNTVFFV